MSNIVEKKKKVQGLLQSKTIKEQIAMALPKHINPDVMIRVALTTVSKQPKLLDCDQASLLGAIITSSQLGLMPDGALGEAYLIPFGKRVQFIPGYRGLVNLAYRSGKVKELYAEAVYENDEFSYSKGLNRDLVHNPSGTADKSKEAPTHFYAIIKLTNGGIDFEVMSKKDVDFIRNRSQGKNNKVWDDYYEEMGKKTVLRKLLKMAPLSTEVQQAVSLDEQHFELGKNQMNSQQVSDFADELGFDPYEEIEDAEKEAQAEKAKSRAEAQNKKSQAATDAAQQAINLK